MTRSHTTRPFKVLGIQQIAIGGPGMGRLRKLCVDMFGRLVEVSVQPGQKVQVAERVAVIEAMKMENVLFAAQDGVVKKVVSAKGESLTLDQMIVEFGV